MLVIAEIRNANFGAAILGITGKGNYIPCSVNLQAQERSSLIFVFKKYITFLIVFCRQ
jgi:hypothetical protein